MVFQKLARKLDLWLVGAGDRHCDPQVSTYLISFPKTGRTWLRLLIGKVLCEQYGLEESRLLDLRELTQQVGLPGVDVSHDGSDVSHGYEFFKFARDKSIFASKKIIFLLRDPRDVMVSCYFQATKRDYSTTQYNGTLSEFIRSHRYGVHKLLDFYTIWWRAQSQCQAFLPVRYEALHAQGVQELGRVMQFLGLDTSPKVLARAVAFAEFSNMKKLEQAQVLGDRVLQPTNPHDPESYKVRRGQIGGYRDYLSLDDIAYLERALGQWGCPWVQEFYR